MHQKRARENPYVLECEKIRKQHIRQEKRKINEISEVNVPRKRFKHDTDTLPNSQQKDFKTIQESIKQFHSNIAIGPLYVCSCCHQTWFRKSVSMLKNTHISAESRRLHCTNFTSIGNEEWLCHTFLSALRECKPPKLSVSNGIKMGRQASGAEFASVRRKINSTAYPIYANKRITTWWPVLPERKYK